MKFTLLLTCLSISGTIAMPLNQEAKPEEPFHNLKLPHQPADNTASPPVDSTLGGLHLNHDHLGSESFQDTKSGEPFQHLKLPRQSADSPASPPVVSALDGVHINHDHLGSPSFHEPNGTIDHDHQGQHNVTAELKHKFFKAMDSFVSKHGHNRTILEEKIRNLKLHHNTTSFPYHGWANMSHLVDVMAEWAHLNPNNHEEDSKHDAAHDA